MNGQGAQQQRSPPQEQQQPQKHEERAIISQLQEMHGVQPETWQATINAEQPADALPNTYRDITPDIYDSQYYCLASQPFGYDYTADLFGLGPSFFAELPPAQNIFRSGNFYNTIVFGDADGLFLGSANDFASPIGPYELFVPPNHDNTLAVPMENVQPQLNSVIPTQTPSFSQPNTVSNPTNSFPRGNRLKRPILTLQTENIRGRNIFYPSRWPFWQTGTSSSLSNQFTGATASSPPPIDSSNPTKVPFGTPPSLYPTRNEKSSLLDNAVVNNKRDEIHLIRSSLMRDLDNPQVGEGIFEPVQVNPLSQPNAPALCEPQQGQIPWPLCHVNNRCPQDSCPIDSAPMELENLSLLDQALMGDTQSQQIDVSGSPLFHESMAFTHSNDKLSASLALGITDFQPSPGNPREGYAKASKDVKAWGLMSVVDSNTKDSGYVSAMNATRAAPRCCDEQELEVERMDHEEDFDNAATVVTDGTELNLPQTTKGYFIQQFAEELLIEAPPVPVPAGALDRISKVLPDLLKQYAFRLTKKTQSQDQKNAVAFVRQNRTYIAAALHEKWCGYEESTQRKLFLNEDHAETSWKERVSQWDNAGSADISLSGKSLKYLPDAYDEDEASEMPDLSLYKPHLLGGEAYKWLISRLRMEFLFARPEAFVMEQFREAILQQFPRYEKARISFHLDWNPLAFFEEQGHRGNLADELSIAITITGSSTSAQTTSCERYLLDTWPATGALTLKALQHAISETQYDTPAYTLQNPNLRVSLRGPHTEVEIVGDKDFITDVGQQLGWIGAALRSSAIDGQMCYCVPSVTYSEGIFTIEYTSDPVSATETILSGNCWRPLFNNPGIVRGFPIATRCTDIPDEDLPGLEIPLNMMAELAEAKRVTEIDGRLLIKGFSTLFVPTKRVGSLVIWHMLYNDDDTRISYFDIRGNDISDISVKGLTFPVLESSRHILGWYSVARNLAGSKHAKYDIKTSGLNYPGQGWTFEKVSISGGKIINGGVTFGRGNINTPLHLRRQPVYVKQIYEASCKHVIFYDVGDKRAWLVNGAAALLHLARAYLVFAGKHPFLSTMIKFRVDDLWGPEDEYEASAPFKILCNSTNMDQVIFEDWKPANEAVIDAEGNFVETTKVKDAHFRFRDQVDEIYHIWEQIQEFQTKMTDNIRLTDREKLQGFNFMDVATGESPIKPRFTYLERSGRGWVDLARSLDTITLFGRGFGELLQPSSESNKLCHSWSHVPTGKDYLAVSMSDVSAIFDKRGNATSRPMELVDGLFWHKADKLFESCECAATGARKRRLILRRGTMCDRVQVLLPPSLGRKVDPGPLEEKGAVIFGRSERYRWHWPNQGQPNEATGPDEDSESERPQKKARSSSSSQESQVSEIFSGDTQQTPATSVSEDASSSPRTETSVKK